MQAAIVNPQIDLAQLKNHASQLNPVPQPESFSARKVSFGEMVQKAIDTDLKVASEPASKSNQTEESKLSKAEEKNEKSGKNLDASENAQVSKNPVEEDKLEKENSSSKLKETSKSIEKNAGKIDSKIALNQKNPKNPEKTASEKTLSHENQKEKKVSFADLESLLKNAKKIGSDESENAAISIEEIKNLLDDEDSVLIASLTQAENLIKAQNSENPGNLAQVSEETLNSLEGIEDSETKNGRSFALDKDGKIVVKDLRTEKFEKAENLEGAKTEKSEKIASNSKELAVTDVKFDRNSAEMTMEVANSVQQNLVSSSDQTASAQGSNFQAMLTNQIQQNAGEFVKAGSIVLKDNDVGSIKLILKPESLGNVKVDLQISDKSITGRILVASQEAFNAFKESAESLKQAFIESGFENANFDLSFAGQNANGSESGQPQENPAAKYQMARAYGNITGDSASDYLEEEILEKSLNGGINIVA